MRLQFAKVVLSAMALLVVLLTFASGTPPLFKSTRYPPQTAEEKAMWDWWRNEEKADPKFEWKRPIDFYGQLADQFGKPVADADVRFEWTVIGGTKLASAKTSKDGRFSLTGETGKRLVVTVLKEGYLQTLNAHRSFEYAAFFDDLFYVPDEKSPTPFTLRKLVAPEPMAKFFADARAPLGETRWLDVERGKIDLSGDISISVIGGAVPSSAERAVKVTLEAQPGAGFLISSEEFLDLAPESNYQRSVELAPDHSGRVHVRMFVKSRSGKFAAVDLQFIPWMRRQEATYSTIIYYNPSGSRNLEFDQRKQINP